jgi:hypothetical protein
VVIAGGLYTDAGLGATNLPAAGAMALASLSVLVWLPSARAARTPSGPALEAKPHL